MPNFLWGFSTNNSSDASGKIASTNALTPIPKLGPAGTQANNVSNKGSTAGNQQVNVVRDFYWTYSKPGDVSRSEVPKIILTERALRTNALISQLKYSLGDAINTAPAVVATLSQFSEDISLTQLIQKIGGTIGDYGGNAIAGGASAAGSFIANTGFGQGVAKAATSAGSAASQYVLGKTPGQYAADIAALANKIASDNNTTIANSPILKPYQNLYLTEPTGWVYILPYFDNNQATQGNQFSDSGSQAGSIGKLMGTVANIATDAAEIASAIASPTQVTYVERAKFYNYASDGGESITVEFPLINTGSVTYDDVVRNWQLLFLLVYQNRPGKTGLNVVEQPVIYQVEVPGVKFFPYCYITGIGIDFVGSRREMSINIPSNGTTVNNTSTSTTSNNSVTTIKTIIPDAYKVRITLQSMTANSKNFMQHMISNHNIIETA